MGKLAVGIVRTSHGVQGYVKVKSFSGETAHFSEMREVLLIKNNREKAYRIEAVKPFHQGVLIKFEGVDSPEAGKLLAGSEIWAERGESAPLEEGEFYAADVVGCHLYFQGSDVGVVRSIIENGATDLLEVKVDKGTRIVPLTEQFVGEIDVENKTIELKDDWVLS
ncbi:MAG: ribosome maturation factor RimM [Spirochaetia bacterium]